MQECFDFMSLLISDVAELIGEPPMIYFLGIWFMIGLCRALRMLMFGERKGR